jgi:Subtilase family
MSDATIPPVRPLLHPVLVLRKEAAEKEASGGGKKESDIVSERLTSQRLVLADEVSNLRGSSSRVNSFSGDILLVSEMFDDSFAVSKSPRDLFRGPYGLALRGAARDGYLAEVHIDELSALERRIREGTSVGVRCDISRVKSIRVYGSLDIYRDRSPSQLWDEAVEHKRGHAFYVWLTPLRRPEARQELLDRLLGMRRMAVLIPTAPRVLFRQAGTTETVVPDLAERQDSLAVMQRNYRSDGHGRAVIQVPSQSALERIVASGAFFRIEPVREISVRSPGEGVEPRTLSASIANEPIVGVVDGGCTARRYNRAEAWREPAFISDGHAATVHGNRVSSIVIHGHEWNNNLPLPELYCRIGVVQVIARSNVRVAHDPARLISYLDGVMGRHPETRVWNLSWNETVSADPIYVSALGHDLRVLARKHNDLLVISAGNVSQTQGDRIAPPADCEAALVVGSRQFDLTGVPTTRCPESLPGHGPEFLLVPQVTGYSPLRLLGGIISRGTSFPTGLMSALAAHAFANLRDPTPDFVRALILDRTDLSGYDPYLGWGTPCGESMPWHCAPGAVTLAFRAALRAGIQYYWEEIPIPRELVRNGKLYGHVSLTTIHHPLCNAESGPNYIATRVASSIQYPNVNGDFTRLVGSKVLDNTAELGV